MQSRIDGGLFRVAILGRPNVGKSTLFNLLTRTRSAVVKDEPGVTRDIQVGQADWWGKSFEVLDTGGLTESKDRFSALIYKQVMGVLKSVDLLVLIMDGRAGLHPEDKDIIRVAKESGKPFFLVINKVDQDSKAELMKAEFYELGFDMITTSFEHSINTDKVVEKILEKIEDEKTAEREGLRFAIVGKPNVGKSSLVNAILGEKRMIVSEIAGTTVDAIETPMSYKNQNLILVDTAGLRRQAKRNKTGDDVEIIASYKSFDAIDVADIVFLVVDATQGPTDQDAKMAEYIFEKNKAVIMVANKVDLAKKLAAEPKKWFRARMEREFHFASDIPIVFTSAETGEGIEALLDKALEVWGKLDLKIPTSKLNDFFYTVIRQAPAPVYGTTNVKFYYLTQTKQKPPSFIAFANHPEGVTPSYRRFLMNRIQAEWNLEGIPVRVFVMKSGG